MYRHLLLTLIVLFASVLMTLAVPMPVPESQNVTIVDVEKRITHSGRGTWFHPGYGNCGQWNTDQDPIVAMSLSFYNQNNGNNCDQWLQVTANGKSAWAYVRDSCPSCAYPDLDMSPAVFSQLADLSVGVLDISWNFMPKGWRPS